MSMSSLLSISTRALTANQLALQVTGHNIANANTAGFSRQSVQLQSAAGQFMGNGYYGKGVDVVGVQRSHSDFLTQQVALTHSAAAADSARSTNLGQLEQVFQTGAAGLGAGVNSLLNSFSDLASAPTDLSARTAVLSAASDMSGRFQTASQQLDDLQRGVTSQMQGAVSAINGLASRIAALNQGIVRSQGNGQSPNDLLDQRDQAINDLSQYVQVSTVAATDGSVSIFVGGSQPLVMGASTLTASLQPDSFDASRQQFVIGNGNQRSAFSADQLGGGEMAGLLRFQNQDLPDARNQLGRLALTTGTSLNQQHQLGLDLNGQTGQALFSLPPVPDGMPASGNLGNAHIQVQVGTTSALVASDYEVSFDAGQVLVKRLSDGQQSSFASLPVQIDGLHLQLASGSAQNGDRFLIQPYRDAALLQPAISSPSQLAAANPVAAQMGAQNLGTLNLSGLQVTQSDPNQSAPVTLTFTSAGSFDVSGTGTGNPTGQAFLSGQAISFNGWSLTLQGSPKAGDSVTISPNTLTRNSAGNAQAMLSLRDAPLIDGASLSDGYASVLTEIGTRVQEAQQNAKMASNMASDAIQARDQVSGVNLDEEAAKLLQYQQAYQAAAKIIQVAQNVFDTLLQGMGR